MHPSAFVIPGRAGTITLGMPSSCASSAACRGPAPPNANSAKSRGSWPRASDTMRSAPAMRSLAMRSTAAAASSASMPSAAPICSSKRAAIASRDTGASTDSSVRGSSRPRSRLASVTVIRSPPRPKQIGPGEAPALSGPTCRSPASLTNAMEPPPAPMVWTSTIGTWMGIAYSTSRSELTAGTPPRMSPTSQLVPPMSQVITFSKPAPAAVYAAAITPEAGPDMTVFTAASAATRAETVPPLPRMTRTSRRYARAASSSTRRER